jgi:hypothetical protein
MRPITDILGMENAISMLEFSGIQVLELWNQDLYDSSTSVYFGIFPISTNWRYWN